MANVHLDLFELLRVATCVLQFYGKLTLGYFTDEEIKRINQLVNDNIDRLNLMKETFKWDGRYDLVMTQYFETDQFIKTAKSHIRHNQICEDKVIADYIIANPEFYLKGISLKDLKNLLAIDDFFYNGHMLHDIYHGYPEKHLFRFQVDCLDYLYSAAHFYNEGYDYYMGRKTIKSYDSKDVAILHPYEMTRLQMKEEVMFRTFREAYINLIFFVESFVNSVGFDAYLSDVAKTEIDANNLRGIQSVKGEWKTYSSLRKKMENISRITSGVELDTTKDPVKTYLEISVELRNQYVHSSFDKPKLQYTLEDWKQKCDEMIDHWCFDVLNTFWKACYPTRVFPRFLFNEFYGKSFKGHQGRFMVTK